MFQRLVRVLIVFLAVGIISGVDSADPKPPLEISIAVPLRFDKRSIELYKPGDHFHVVIRNTSDHNVSLWREWCSWGYFNLSFEMTDGTGDVFVVKKKPRGWGKNFPDSITLEPGDSYVLEVTFDAGTWDNAPVSQSGESLTFDLRAIYEITPSEEATKAGVWTGKIASEKKQYTLWR